MSLLAHEQRHPGKLSQMSVQNARENAILDALTGRTATIGQVMAALDGNGMPASPHAVSDILASLARRGLVTRSGPAYRITPSGQAAVRRRRAASPAARDLLAPAPWASRHWAS
jgi:DNA-binding PadR family transcriptional regulator